MIITRTPFRISFAGGGSDLKAYYEKYGGMVVSTSINKYLYLSAHPYFFRDGYLLKYSKHEETDDVSKINHRIIRQIFSDYDIKGIDFNSSADIPSGTGLASSSAFTSGLINLCNALTEKYMTKEEIADLACKTEIEKLGEPIGKQDQYACAVGGLNSIEFNPDDTVTVEKIYMNPDNYKKLENNLLLFYTGKTRAAGDILSEQKQNIVSQEDKINNMHKMVKLAIDLKNELLRNNIDAMGDILHQGWMYKRELASGISNSDIDYYYDIATNNGATGGKLLGAGGGGFLLFYVKEENQGKLRQSLSGLKEIKFKFDTVGTTIIYYDNV